MQIELEDGIILVVQDEKIKDMLLEKIGLRKQEKMLIWADKLSSDKKWEKRVKQIKNYKKNYSSQIRMELEQIYLGDVECICDMGGGRFIKKPITSQFIHHLVRRLK